MAESTDSEGKSLSQNFSQMLDGELEQLAARSNDLTAAAREAVQKEMERRGLVAELATDENSLPEPVWQERLTVWRFRDLPEALLAKGGLESAGIECDLVDDNMVRLDWFLSNLIGGIRLQVAPEDAEAARAILDQPIPEDLDVPGVGEYQQPRCPKCGSLDTAFRELNKPVAYISAYLNIPLPVEHMGWRCHSCKAEWMEDNEESEANSGSSPPDSPGH